MTENELYVSGYIHVSKLNYKSVRYKFIINSRIKNYK